MGLTWQNFDSWLNTSASKRNKQESQNRHTNNPFQENNSRFDQGDNAFKYITESGTSFPDRLNIDKIIQELGFYGKADTGINASNKSPYKSASGNHDDVYSDGLLNLYSMDRSITGGVYNMYRDPLLNSYSMDKSITGDVYKMYRDPLLNSYSMDKSITGGVYKMYKDPLLNSYSMDKSITGDVYNMYKDPLLNSYSLDKSISGDIGRLYNDPVTQSFFHDWKAYSGGFYG